MDITFECNSCGQGVVVDRAGKGLLVDCPKCGKPMEVPYKSKPKPKTEPPVLTSTPPVAKTKPAVEDSFSPIRIATSRGISSKQGMVMIGVLTLGLFVLIFKSFAPPPNWEYMVDFPSEYVLTQRMNALGKDGWELVSVRRNPGEMSVKYEMIFKRQKYPFESIAKRFRTEPPVSH